MSRIETAATQAVLPAATPSLEGGRRKVFPQQTHSDRIERQEEARVMPSCAEGKFTPRHACGRYRTNSIPGRAGTRNLVTGRIG